jgi:hypothetical protein
MKAKSKKRINQHVIHRSEQRYGIRLNSKKRKEIVRIIQSNGSTGLKRISNTKTLYMVNYEGQDILVLYSRARKTILTVYPKESRFYKEYNNEPETTQDTTEDCW